jgi:hypothetical protein
VRESRICVLSWVVDLLLPILPSWCWAGWSVVNRWSLWVDRARHDRSWLTTISCSFSPLLSDEDVLTGLGIEPNHQWRCLLSHKNFWNTVNQVLNLEYIPVEPHAFCVRRKAHMKSSRSCMECRSGAPCFLYVTMVCWKIVEVVWSVDREPLTFYTRRCACWK